MAEVIREPSFVFDLAQISKSPPDPFCRPRESPRHPGETVMHASSKTTPAGQASALWMSTIAFTACFAVWTIFSIIGIQIKKDLGLNETEFGLLVGTPTAKTEGV
jgi:hypothetical protein